MPIRSKWNLALADQDLKGLRQDGLDWVSSRTLRLNLFKARPVLKILNTIVQKFNSLFLPRGMKLKHQLANTNFRTQKCVKSNRPILILRAVLIIEGQLKMLKVSFGTNRWSVNSILSHSTRNTWIRNSKMKMISSKSSKSLRINKESARKAKRR